MKILGNRVLVSRVEEEKKEGFQTVEVQDNFVYKGKVEQTGFPIIKDNLFKNLIIDVGSIILFAKYSPDTQEIKHEGQDMKIINVDDILAVL